MSKPKRFAEGFWVKDICSTAGYDALLKRMKDGKNTCKELEEFLKQLSKVESEYSQQLQKLSRTPLLSFKDEIGTLHDSCLSVKENLEGVAQEHQDVSTSLNNRLKQLQTFMEEQKQERKKRDDVMKKLQLNRKNHYKKMVDLKKAYEVKSKEADDAYVVLQINKQSQALIKDITKLSARHQQKASEALKAEQQYQESVALVNASRVSWDKEMIITCDLFQELEEKRIVNLRNELWTLTNIGSKCCVNVDMNMEKIRGSLEKCDEKQDIMLAVNERKTGTEKAEEVVFEPYNAEVTNKQTGNWMSKLNTILQTKQGSATMPAMNKPSPHIPITERQAAPLPKTQPLAFLPPRQPLERSPSADPTYDSIDQRSLVSNPNLQIDCNYDYVGTESSSNTKM